MNKTRRDTLIWSLGAAVFSLSGVGSALTADGKWYLIIGTILLLGAGVALGSRAILTARSLND
ncbi:MAG: hypothetical protein JWM01_956 [Arthrobacter sp.]|jgi:hypothetical protein|nr:hypothetical protein [Arthrobacter sp.]